MEPGEKIFYQDAKVTVTQSRFVTEYTTYAMRNISSVTLYKITKSRFVQIVLIILGVLTMLADDLKFLGLLIIAAGILWLYKTKDEYSVRITSNSGESDGFISPDRQVVSTIVNAVNEAMAYRG